MPTPIERCFAEVPRNGRVLDVGCLGFRQVANARVAGRIDLQHAGVDRLPPPDEQPEGFEYRVADIDAERLPFEDDTFDLVVASHVIEHLRRPMEAAAEWVRVCKPGGRIYVEAPSERSLLLPGMPWAHDEFHSLSFFDDPTHVGRPWTPQALHRLARYLGCEPEEARHLSSWRARLLFPYYFLGSIVRRRPDIFEWAVWAALGWASCLVMRKPHHLSGGPVATYTSSWKGNRHD